MIQFALPLQDLELNHDNFFYKYGPYIKFAPHVKKIDFNIGQMNFFRSLLVLDAHELGYLPL